MRSVEDHLAACLAHATPLPPVACDLAEALGLVLAEPVTSPVTLPPFDNSSMDGYAVRVADVAAASAAEPVRLPVVADLPAQAGRPAGLPAGRAARIMTGAPVPAGTEAVVQVEWTDAGVTEVAIERPVSAGQNIRRAGEDVTAGDVVLAAGTVLDPRAIGLLAAVGRAAVAVYRAPRVAVMSTGAELVPPGQPLEFGQIYDSNSYAVAAATRAAGAIVTRLPAVGDDPSLLGPALNAAAREHDLVVTTGGVSAGAYDVVKAHLRERGTVEFVKVAMKPGMPQGVGHLLVDDGAGGQRQVPIVTLPGNPVSAWVSFEVFVRPVVRRLAGAVASEAETVSGVVELPPGSRPWRSPAGKREYARVLLDAGRVRPVGRQNSHLLADLVTANALAIIPPDLTEVTPGTQVQCILLRGTR